MKEKWILGLMLLSSLSSSFGLLEKASAHGVKIEHRTTQSIEINAQYDTGKPLSNAQVTIYAPNDPTTPWQQGQTDEQGNFVFIPDPTQTGYWDVKVRQAGHGGLTSIQVVSDSNTPQVSESEVSENIENPGSFYSKVSTGLSPVQQGLMMGSMLWGCVGTALFFSKFNGKPSSDPDPQKLNQN
ncbi:MAG: carboxypeptidase-like regulatory domain-containing protein [Cyanobacteriota bacterium]|nr:carboxypeptidase-like regulatory domain-containing protein [Cyanobacteriota bacterium]